MDEKASRDEAGRGPARKDAGRTICPVCGAAFECGVAAGAPACWCAGLPPVPPVAGEGCLCPRCLAARAAS